MTDLLPALAEGRPAPELRVVRPSLAAAATTAMVLVDYALAGKATPTPDPQAAALALPADLAEASFPVRAVLAHGTALRSVLMAELPPDHEGHTKWPALRRWLAGLDDDRIRRLLEYGVASVLGYGRPPGEGPTTEEVGASTETFQRHATNALTAWGMPNPAERVGELLDSASVRATLLALLDAIWDLMLDSLWTEQLPALRSAADAAPVPPAGCGGAQWISLVTGLRPDPQYAEAADKASLLTLLPCPGLGRSLSLFPGEEGTWVLYSPAPRPGSARAERGGGERAGIPVTRLAPLAPIMHALGDRTRLAIVLHLLEHGPLPMPRLTDALQVHQSTVSRQIAALRKAGLTDVDESRRIVVNRDAIRQACRTLLEAME